MDYINLIHNNFARLTETQDGQGIADLFQRRHQTFKLGNLAAIAAHEQIQTVLNPH